MPAAGVGIFPAAGSFFTPRAARSVAGPGGGLARAGWLQALSAPGYGFKLRR